MCCIVNATGTKVVEYGYDAWGKPITVAGTMAGTLGEVNPFRYRGYVYDGETGLYYLRCRYYRPEWGRFVNADILIRDNLYHYCKNSPVALFDSCGFSESYSMLETTQLHNIVVEKVRWVVNGWSCRTLTGICGAGPHGGYGYPDVVDSEKRAWEVKFNNTSYGLRAGTAQENRYTNETGYKPGYPVSIEPFDYVLGGIFGKVYITNGSVECGDVGVVYYEFMPQSNPTLDYSGEPAKEEVRQPNTSNLLKRIGLLALVAITMISPIPGDEEAALMLLLMGN